MDTQKMNKKGSTLTIIVISMLVSIGMFSGYYILFAEQMDNYDMELDGKYNETYQILLEEQEDIDDKVTEVRESVNEAEEASNEFLAAIAGFKGLGAALLLLLQFVDSSNNINEAVFFSTDFIPTNVQNLLLIGLIAVVVFVIIAILKGEAKM